MPSHRNRKSRLPSEAKVFRHRPPAAVPPAPGRPGVSALMGEGTSEAGPFGLLSEGAVSPCASGADEGLSFDRGSRRIEVLYLISAPGQHLRTSHRRIRSAKSNWRKHMQGHRLTAGGSGPPIEVRPVASRAEDEACRRGKLSSAPPLGKGGLGGICPMVIGYNRKLKERARRLGAQMTDTERALRGCAASRSGLQFLPIEAYRGLRRVFLCSKG